MIVLCGSAMHRVSVFIQYYTMQFVVVVVVFVIDVPELHLHSDGVLFLLVHLDSL